MIESITGIGLFIVAVAVLLIGAFFAYYFLDKKVKGKKTSWGTARACSDANRAISMRNMTDYFWKESLTFTWITIFLIFFIALGFVTETFYGLLSSILFIIISVFFGIFSYKSFYAFEDKAKAKLTEFEDSVRKSIEAETGFKGDKYTDLLSKDKEIETKPQTFEFPTAVTKIAFPPLEKNVTKHNIVSTKKLEFLVLSREYFSICRGASTFNLLVPAQDGPPKKCAEKKGVGGECNEYYYSQMQNVQYDAKEKCIRIIYNTDTGHKDVTFPCAKPASKNPMKALKEKLRLTERQKLQKIQEHKNYEDIRDKKEKKESEEE